MSFISMHVSNIFGNKSPLETRQDNYLKVNDKYGMKNLKGISAKINKYWRHLSKLKCD